MLFGTYIEINYSALKNNINIIKEKAKNTEILGVVKANAYGHGDLQIANALEKFGLNYLGVARVSEGIRLRNGGININIIVLGGADENEYEELVKYDLIPVIYSKVMATKLNNYLKFRNLSINVHVKVDTGMHRLGLKPSDIGIFKNLKFLNVQGLMSHFLDAGINTSNWSDIQLKLFNEVIENWKSIYAKLPSYIHIQNTAGFASYNIDSVNMARIGIGMYGYGMDKLKPVFRLFSSVKDIKNIKKGETVCYGGWYKAPQNTNIAIIPIGYGDGFMCSARSGSVLIKNKKYPIIGVISMDHFIIDLLNDTQIQIGDKVTVINEKLSAKYWAGICNTNVYEILTIINPRIKRLYNS